MKKFLLFAMLFTSHITFSQLVYVSSNIIDNDYDRSIIFVKDRANADCFIKIVKSRLQSDSCGKWFLTPNKLESKYKFLITTPYSNRWIKGKRPLKVYISNSWFLNKHYECSCGEF